MVRIMSNGDDPTHWDFDALMVHNKPRASRKSPIHLSPIHHPWTAERAAIAVSEPSTLTGYQPFIDTPWVRELPSSNPGAGNSNAIVSVGTGPQETLDRKLESRMGGDAGADGRDHGAQGPYVRSMFLGFIRARRGGRMKEGQGWCWRSKAFATCMTASSEEGEEG